MKLSRRSVLALLPAAPTALRALAATEPSPASKLFIGTYTDPVGSTPGAKGIYTCSWNAVDGGLGDFELIAATPDPSFLALSPRDPNRLFAVNETSAPNGGVTAFAMRPGEAQLRKLNTVSSGANGPCHLALDRTGRSLFVANYGGGALSSYKVSRNGLSEPVSVLRFSGHSIDPERQAAPHTHCVLFSPDNRFLLVNDLGLDRIMVFHVDPATAKLRPATTPYYSATPGSGPRHSIFHPNGRWVYSANEINSTIDQFEWGSSDGTLTHKATISSLPPEARNEKNAPAEVATDASGKFLYVSNRFHDSIGVFAIDQATGELSPVQDIPCGGKTPRHFALDPTGNWLLVANQDSRNIVVFARDRTSGKLTATGRNYLLDAPICILFA
jgi:6-phosphogluconolactonase